MSIELVGLILAFLVVLLRIYLGWRFGVTSEMRWLLAGLFATLVVVRFLHYWTTGLAEMTSVDPRYLAAITFTVAFIVAWIVAAFAVNLFGEVFQSVLPNKSDNVLGAVCGLLSGTLYGGAIMLVLALAFSGKLESQPSLKVFQFVERHLVQVPPTSLARTPLPQIKPAETEGAPPVLVWK